METKNVGDSCTGSRIMYYQKSPQSIQGGGEREFEPSAAMEAMAPLLIEVGMERQIRVNRHHTCLLTCIRGARRFSRAGTIFI
jgi:hypothetical protein